MTLTQSQVDFFMEHGYLRYGAVLETSEVELLRREDDLEFKKAGGSNQYRNLSVGDASSIKEKKSASQQMLQIMQMCERNIHFRRVLHNPRILGVVEDIL